MLMCRSDCADCVDETKHSKPLWAIVWCYGCTRAHHSRISMAECNLLSERVETERVHLRRTAICRIYLVYRVWNVRALDSHSPGAIAWENHANCVLPIKYGNPEFE